MDETSDQNYKIGYRLGRLLGLLMSRRLLVPLLVTVAVAIFAVSRWVGASGGFRVSRGPFDNSTLRNAAGTREFRFSGVEDGCKVRAVLTSMWGQRFTLSGVYTFADTEGQRPKIYWESGDGIEQLDPNNRTWEGEWTWVRGSGNRSLMLSFPKHTKWGVEPYDVRYD